MDARGEKLPDLSFLQPPMSHPQIHSFPIFILANRSSPAAPRSSPLLTTGPRPPSASSLLLTAPPIIPSSRTPFSSFPLPHPRDPDPLVSSCGASRRRPASTQGGAPRRSGGRGGGLANVSEKVRLLRADGSVAEMVLLCVSLLLLRPSPMTPYVLPQVL